MDNEPFYKQNWFARLCQKLLGGVIMAISVLVAQNSRVGGEVLREVGQVVLEAPLPAATAAKPAKSGDCADIFCYGLGGEPLNGKRRPDGGMCSMLGCL